MADDVKSDMEADVGEHPGYKLALKVIEDWPIDGREFTRERWLADLINTQCAEIRRLETAAALRAPDVQSPAERGEEGKETGDAYLAKKDTGVADPRDPDYSRPGIFATHNCWKCRDGQQPCVCGDPRRCEYPHARND